MPNEAQMWERLRPAMAELQMDPVRVENPVLPGTPDVNFVQGWAELKNGVYPKRGVNISLGHPPTPQQKVWLMRRWMMGGAAWLVLRLHKDWFIFPGHMVRVVWEGDKSPTISMIREYAWMTAPGPVAVAQFLKAGRNDINKG